MNEMVASHNPIAAVADKGRIRRFVTDLDTVAQTVKDARADVKEAIAASDVIQGLDQQMQVLKEERRNAILQNPTIQGYDQVLQEALSDRRDLIFDAKQDGVPKKEIDVAIKMLKQDVDPAVATEVYANISDLVD